MGLRIWTLGTAMAVAIVATGAALSRSAPASYGAARFDARGNLLFPAEYRHWTYLTSGLGMSYNPAAAAEANPIFDSVFADPAAEAAFRKTGHWPEGTVLVLELRRSSSRGSINLHGSFQTGEPVAIELHVHDSKRFKGGWGFFKTDAAQKTSLIAYTETCYSCHQQHAAVDTTFVQFYPTLLTIAQAKGTLSAAFINEEATRTP